MHVYNLTGILMKVQLVLQVTSTNFESEAKLEQKVSLLPSFNSKKEKIKSFKFMFLTILVLIIHHNGSPVYAI